MSGDSIYRCKSYTLAYSILFFMSLEHISPSVKSHQRLETHPEIFSWSSDQKRLQNMLDSDTVTVVDTIESQVAELVQLRRPSYNFSDDELTLAVRSRLEGTPEAYGNWVYYPWKKTLVHLLGEAEFREVRTNRNMHKVTAEEQGHLAKKKVGVIGMSVGSGITMALAMERIGGELRIADFDTLELSNLNRIRTSVIHLALPKTTIVAREIAELDPYIEVKIYAEGVNKQNIAEFLSDGGQIDLLIEECDSFPVKLLARVKARELGIPVIMDTSDRGMVDIERFDLNPNLPILNGKFTEEQVQKVIEEDAWSPEMVTQFASPQELSERMLVSLQEMNKTIRRWPQLGSEVTMGAGVAAAVARLILLGKYVESGRKFIDVDGIFLDKK